jgi:hypothetical protein
MHTDVTKTLKIVALFKPVSEFTSFGSVESAVKAVDIHSGHLNIFRVQFT